MTAAAGASPVDLWALAQHFATLSLIAISGAIATVPEMHRFLVDEKHWMTHTQFNDSVAMAQAAPGPNVFFVALFGWQVARAPGAAVAFASIILPASVLVYAMWRWKRSREDTQLVKALRLGLSPIAAGLTVSTGLVLAQNAAVIEATQRLDWRLAAVVVGTVIFSLRSKRNPLWMIAAGALVGIALSF